MPSKRLFLGNLSFSITAKQLEQHIFGLNLGATEVIAIIDPGSGQCRGFGFAEFPSEPVAIAALAFLSANGGYFIDGRPIRADFAVDRNRGKPHRPSEHNSNTKFRDAPTNGRKPQSHRQRENAQPYADVWSDSDRQRRRK